MATFRLMKGLMRDAAMHRTAYLSILLSYDDKTGELSFGFTLCSFEVLTARELYHEQLRLMTGWPTVELDIKTGQAPNKIVVLNLGKAN